jgi:hypothetical protein
VRKITQAPHELFARADLRLGLDLDRLPLLGGQEHLRLDVDELRREHQELCRHVDLERLEDIERRGLSRTSRRRPASD